MGLYGIRDAANLIFVNKRTKEIALYMDYANATTSEWSSESVYATKKGANAIRWDNDKNGTLVVDTEVFDFSYLAMAMGSDIIDGRDSIMQRVEVVIDETKQETIGIGDNIDEKNITIIKLKKPGDVEHVGRPLFNASAALDKLPEQVRNVTVAVNDTTARINFQTAAEANRYLIFRDDTQIADVNTTSYTDTGLESEKQYTYKVQAVNDYGKGAASAIVKPTTGAAGSSEFTSYNATTLDRNNAAKNVGEVVTVDDGAVKYSYSNGVVKFSEEAVVGDAYAIYFLEETENVRTLEIAADKFADNFEIFGQTKIRSQEDGRDEMVELHFYNAKPQSNFTLTQSATEPTSLSITFDLLPVRVTKERNGKQESLNLLMEYKVIQ